MEITKRNGKKDLFNKEKIEQAILKSMKNGSGIVKERIAKEIGEEIEILAKLGNKEALCVEGIEKLVYQKLIDKKQIMTAKAYEGYRAVQKYKRENDPLIESVLGLVNLTNEEVMSENANKDATLVNTSRDLIAGEVSKFITKNYMLPPHLIQAEELGIIKIHDKDYFASPMHNCDLVNLKDMFENGTVLNKKRIRKPNNLRTAMTLATQISAQVAASQYGGQTMSISHLAPFVRITKEKIRKEILDDFKDITQAKLEEVVERRLKKEIKDCVQLFNYQINTISCTSGQTPFLSISLYINENPGYEEETAMLVEEFLHQRIEGIENEYGIKVSQTFPKMLYFLDENNAYEDSKYFYLTKLAAESVAKRLSPDFISVKKMKEIYGVAFPPIN